MYSLAHWLVVVGHGVLVGSQGPPEHWRVQSHPVQLLMSSVFCWPKYQVATLWARLWPSTWKVYQSALQERQWTRQEEL